MSGRRKKRGKILLFSVLGVLLAAVAGGWWAADRLTERLLTALLLDSADLAGLTAATPAPSEDGIQGGPSEKNGEKTVPGGGVPSPAADGPSAPSGSAKTDAGEGVPDRPAADRPGASPALATGKGGSLSEQELRQAQATITAGEKAKVMSVLLSRLSPSEIRWMLQLAQGGVTVEEKRQAKAVILQKLTEDEYNELISIAAKLGLSSGRPYRETMKDLESR